MQPYPFPPVKNRSPVLQLDGQRGDEQQRSGDKKSHGRGHNIEDAFHYSLSFCKQTPARCFHQAAREPSGSDAATSDCIQDLPFLG